MPKQITYTKNFIQKTITELAAQSNVSVFFTEDDNVLNVAQATNNEIIFSKFDNLEYMFIAFFHEYAHCVLTDKIPFRIPNKNWNQTSLMQFELQITMAGLNFAQEQGFVFSDEAVQWLIEQNLTYGNKNLAYGIFTIENNKDKYVLNQCYSTKSE